MGIRSLPGSGAGPVRPAERLEMGPHEASSALHRWDALMLFRRQGTMPISGWRLERDRSMVGEGREAHPVNAFILKFSVHP